MKHSFAQVFKLWTLSIFGLLIVLNSILYISLWNESKKDILAISFLDVGQGDAIYIRTPRGGDMLVDTGPGRSVLRELGSVMPFLDKELSVVLLTHPDADHIGGFIPVSSSYTIQSFVHSGNKKDTNLSKHVETTISQKNIPSVVGTRGMEIVLDQKNDIRFFVLYPSGDVSGWEANDASLVGVLSYGDVKFLLTGDAPIKTEDYIMVHDKDRIHGAVLKLGHHGSRTSSGFLFLKTLMPPFAIVSAGKDNRYGHPHKDVITKLESLHVPVLSTAEEGTITFITNGDFIKIQ